MSTKFASLIQAVGDRGFAFCQRLLPEWSTQQVAEAIGEPIALSANPAVHALTPKAIEEAAPNTYSGNYGLGVFPMHTDFANWPVPPRYLMLRCLVGSQDVPTTIVDSQPIVGAIGAPLLMRALMKPRRKVAGRMSLLPILHATPEGSLIRWDERYLQPASKAGESCVVDLNRYLKCAPYETVFLAQLGDTVVVDNWKMLHGRGAVPEDSRSRLIERVYLKALAQ